MTPLATRIATLLEPDPDGQPLHPDTVRLLQAAVDVECGKNPDDRLDPYSTPEYQAFVASMVPHCHCRESLRPCDGVLAGGICDGMVEEEDRVETIQIGDDE